MKFSFSFFILGFYLTSCATNSLKNNDMIDKFTWNIQLAGYDYNKYDEKGEISYTDFIIEMDKFPWIEQIESYGKIQQGCSPTLSVKDHKTGTEFWVSMSGNKDEHAYLIGYVFPKLVKGFLGLGSPKEKRWVNIYETQDSEVVKNCFKSFFNRNPENLISITKKLKLYGDMEAQN